MHIRELWRYPVKSMRDERLAEAVLHKSSMQGDRSIVVASHGGRQDHHRAHSSRPGRPCSKDHGSVLWPGPSVESPLTFTVR
jgi:uncharacterized protein YcbX